MLEGFSLGRHTWLAMGGVFTLLVISCSGSVESTSAPSCEGLAVPPCGNAQPLCLDGRWNCNGCDPRGVRASDCWSECYGLYPPHCLGGQWACEGAGADACGGAGGGSVG